MCFGACLDNVGIPPFKETLFKRKPSKVVVVHFTLVPHKHYDIGISSFSGAGDVEFSLRGTTYQNNSIVILEDIGESDDALLCITNQTACCQYPYQMVVLGNWFFPNRTRVRSSGIQSDIYRSRGQMVVLLNRKRGGVEGIYRCEIPDSFGFTQTLYIGVYSASTGEWYMYTPVIK